MPARLRHEPLETRLAPALFGLPAVYPDLVPPAPNAGSLLTDMVAADFNRDGRPDVAAVRPSGAVTVYRNDGGGRFTPATLLPPTFETTQSTAAMLAAGDVNADGRTDLVAVLPTGSGTYELRLFRGRGDLGFDAGTVLAGGLGPEVFVAVADLNGDGADDIVAAARGARVLLGRAGGDPVAQVGDGGSGTIYTYPFFLADVTDDGVVDLVGWPTSLSDPQLRVYRGTGDGTFAAATVTPLPAAHSGAAGGYFEPQAVGDVNGDGKPDLVATVGSAGEGGKQVSGVALLPGRGDGTFGPVGLLPVPPFEAPHPLRQSGSGKSGFAAVGDFDADGRADVAYAAAVPTTPTRFGGGHRTEYRVAFGDGAGGFPRSQATGAHGELVADLDGDGRSDLAGTVGTSEAAHLALFVSSRAGEVAVAAASGGDAVRLLVAGGEPRALNDWLPAADAAAQAQSLRRVATADVTGDGAPDLIGVLGPGMPPQLIVQDGVSGRQVAILRAFEASFTGGLFVAAGDIDGDGRAEVVVTPDRGGGPVAAVYSGAKLAAGLPADDAQITRFLGIDDKSFRGGARPALGDVNGDGKADLVVAAGFLGGPRVAVFNGAEITAGNPSPGRLVADFFAFEQTLRNGAFVAAGDVTGDGRADLAFGGGPGGGPRVRVFDGSALLAAGPFVHLDEVAGPAQRANFFAGNPDTRGGVRVALPDADRDRRADLLVGSGEGEPGRARVYLSGRLLSDPGPAPDQEFDLPGVALPDGVFVG